MHFSLPDELSIKVVDSAKKRLMTPSAFVVEAVQNYYAELRSRGRLENPQHMYTERLNDTTVEDAI